MADRERDMWWAWHVAFLHRVDVKHFPKLSELMRGLRPKAVPKGEADRKKVGDELLAALLQLPVAAKPEPGTPEANKPKDIVIFPDKVAKPPAPPPVPEEAVPGQDVEQGAEQATVSSPDRPLPPTHFSKDPDPIPPGSSPDVSSVASPSETPDEATDG